MDWDDEWHPDSWVQPLPYCYVFLHERNEDLYAIVDREDWPWVCQNIWWRVGGQNGLYYAGRRGGRPWRSSIMLHIEVLKRFMPKPEGDLPHVGDHINHNTFDCRRQNLQWLTDGQNKGKRHEKSANQGFRRMKKP